MLSSIDRLTTLLKASGADSATTFQLEDLLSAADRAVKVFCKQDIESQIVTDYYDGTDRPELALRQRPVVLVTQTGTLTSGSAVVTNLTDTSRILAGAPAQVNQTANSPIPSGATVSAVNSATQLTLSAPATGTGAFTIFFGINCFLDLGGFGGQGPNGPFDKATELPIGVGFALNVDRPDGSSKCGVVRRLGGGFTGAGMVWPSEWGRGTLTRRMPPVWPAGWRNVRVTYQAGYLPGSPELIELGGCVNALAAYMLRTWPLGGTAVQSESVQGWSYGAAQLALGQSPELGTTRSILARYRDFSI